MRRGHFFFQEETVKNASQVRGGTQPAGSHTGFLSACEDFPVSGGRNWCGGFTWWPQQISGSSSVLLFTRDPHNFTDCLKAGATGQAPLVI